MRYCMILLFAGAVACGEESPSQDRASTGGDAPEYTVEDRDVDGFEAVYDEFGGVVDFELHTELDPEDFGLYEVDCNDNNPELNPGADPQPGSYTDYNCDGEID